MTQLTANEQEEKMAARNGKSGLLEKVRNIYSIGFLKDVLIIVQRYSEHDMSDYVIYF